MSISVVRTRREEMMMIKEGLSIDGADCWSFGAVIVWTPRTEIVAPRLLLLLDNRTRPVQHSAVG